MRDALRAVGAVIGVLALATGGAGAFRGWLTRAEWFAVVGGLVVIAVVAVIPAAKPRPPVYEDGDRGPRDE